MTSLLALHWVLRCTAWVVRRRWAIVGASLLLAGLAGHGLRHLEFTADYRVYFSPENPQLAAYDAFEGTYAKGDSLLFVLQPRDRDVFTPETLGTVKWLTDEAWRIPYATRVDSLTNFQHLAADGDDLAVGELVEDPEALDASGLARVRGIALQEPALVDRLVARDGGTTGVLVTLQFPGTDHTQHLPAAVSRAEALAAGLRARQPDLRVGLTGVTLFSHAEAMVSQQDLRTLLPVMYAIMIAVMWALLRSGLATLAALVVVTLAAAVAVGVSAWLGVKMNPSIALAPVIILTVGVADSVHILMTLFEELRAGRPKGEALAESLRLNAEPVFLTSLTTVVGFLSLNFSDTPPFRALGNIAALGVAVAWALSMTLLPALVALLPIRAPRPAAKRPPPLSRFADFVVARRGRLLGGVGVGALALLAFIPRLEVDDRFVEWFSERLAFRRDTDFASAHLTGLYTLEFSIAGGGPGAIADPTYLRRLEDFAQWLRAQPEVVHVASFTDVMKRLNRALHGDAPAWHRLPDDRALAAQYLLLYEMSLPYGLDLTSQINLDKSATRLTATLRTVPMRGIQDVARRAEAWLTAHTPPSMPTEATGLTIVFVHLADRNIRSMLRGTALAFLLIAATLVLALRSWRLGLLSLLPNVLPPALTFGLWGLLVGRVGIIASMVTATCLGLIVDDTVHLLSKYRRARREEGLGAHDAVRYSFAHVGKAVWTTTAILVAGFLVLSLSAFQLNRDLGIFTAITLLFALALDFLLFLPLLMWLDAEPVCTCATCGAGQPVGA